MKIGARDLKSYFLVMTNPRHKSPVNPRNATLKKCRKGKQIVMMNNARVEILKFFEDLFRQ